VVCSLVTITVVMPLAMTIVMSPSATQSMQEKAKRAPHACADVGEAPVMARSFMFCSSLHAVAVKNAQSTVLVATAVTSKMP